MNYIHSHREEWVLRFYDRMKIYKPTDICLETIAKQNRIYLKYHNNPTKFVRLGNYRAINLQFGLDPKDERLEFFHELGHLLRHSGGQLFMTDSFKELQEWDANLFTFYAALPYHMIKKYDLDSHGIITELSHEFVVPEWLVYKRVSFILRRQDEYAVKLL